MKLIAILLLVISPATAQEIYKCTDENGRPQFSDQPCAEDAEVVELEEDSSGISIGPEDDMHQVKEGNARREYDRAMARIESSIRRLQEERTKRLNALDKEYSSLPRQQYTYARRKEIIREMRSLRTEYSNRLNRLYEQRREARDRYQINRK